MRTVFHFVIGLALAACSAELPHAGPFDPDSPAERQAKASLQGTVTLAEEMDFSQIIVVVQNDQRTYTTATDEGGAYRITGVVPGSYRVSLRLRSFIEYSVDVTLRAGDRINLGVVELQPKTARVFGIALLERQSAGRSLLEGGVVVSLEKVASVRGVTLSSPILGLAASVTGMTRTTHSVVSSPDGRFEIPGVAAGHYKVIASSPFNAGVTTTAGRIEVTGEDSDVAVEDILLRPLTGFFEIEGTLADGSRSSLYTAIPDVTLKLSGFNAVKMQVGFAADGRASSCGFGSGMDFASLLPLRLPVEGRNVVCVKYIGEGGKETEPQLGTITYDKTSPVLVRAEVVTRNGYTKDRNVVVEVAASDSLTGLAYVVTAATAQAVSTTTFMLAYQPTLLFPFGNDGLKTFWVAVADQAGNRSAPLPISVVIDTVSPVAVGGSRLTTLTGTDLPPGALTNQTRLQVRTNYQDTSPLEMQVSTTGSFEGVSWEPYAPTRPVDLAVPGSGAGELRSIKVRVRDLAGNMVDALDTNVWLDTIGPAAPSLTIGPAAVSQPVVVVGLGASDAAWVEFAFDSGFVTAQPPIPMAPTAAVTLPSGDGLKAVFARFWDVAGNASSVVADSVVLDTLAPQLAAFSIEQGAYAKTPSVNLRLTAIEAFEMQVAEGNCGGVWEPFTTSKTYWFATTVEEQKRIRVRFRDVAGNTTDCLEQTVIYDATAPWFSSPQPVRIANDATYTTDRVVSLSLLANEADEMQVSESPVFAGAPWMHYSDTTTWILSAGEGLKTVYARFRDRAGNETAVLSDSIVVDTVAPAFNGLSGPAASNVTGVTLSLVASGADQMRLSENADFTGASWQAYTATPVFGLSNSQGQHTVYVQLRDNAGNESVVRSWVVLLDSTAPDVPNVSVLGNGYTKVANVTVQVVAEGANQMLISQYAAMTDATWQPYSLQKAFVLAGADGPKTVYVKVRDAAGNESGVGSAAVVLDTTAPVVSLLQAEDGAGNVITATNALRYYIRLQVTDATTLTAQYAASNVFTNVTPEALQPVRAWDVVAPTAPNGENRTTYVRVVDAAGNETTVGPVTVLVDTIGPTSPSISLAAGLISSPTNVGVSLGALNADFVELSEEISFLNPVVLGYTTNTTYSFAGGEGTKTLYARFVDARGNYSAIVAASTVLDMTAPENAFFTMAEAMPTKESLLHLTLSAVGATQMAIGETSCSSNWEGYAQSKAYALSSTVPGTYQIAVRFRDAAGNTTACLTRDVEFDNVAPTPTASKIVTINNDATYTTIPIVTLSFAVTGATQMMLSNTADFAGAQWEPFSTQRIWLLAPGDGLRNVYATFRDAAGNLLTGASDTVIVDSLPPELPSLSINGGASYTVTTSVTLNLSVVGATTAQVSSDGVFDSEPAIPFAASIPWSLADSEGLQYVYARYCDAAGNCTAVLVAAVTYDKTPPTAYLQINQGADRTASAIVTLSLAGADVTSGIQGVKLANDAAALATTNTVPFETTKIWTLGGALDDGVEETKWVWMQTVDKAGTLSSPVSDTIVFDRRNPTGTLSLPTSVTNQTLSLITLSYSSDTTEMKLSAGNACAGGSWLPVTSSTFWTFARIEGPQDVSVRFRDGAANESVCYGASLTLDFSGPRPSFFDVLGNTGAAPGYSNTANLTLSAAAFDSDCSSIEVAEDVGFVLPTALYAGCTLVSQPYTLLHAEDGSRAIFMRYYDVLGNAGPITQATIILDTQGPTIPAGAFTVAEGSYVASRNITLLMHASEADFVQVSEGTCGGAWETFAASRPFTLSTGDGTKTIAVRFKDRALNTTSCYAQPVTLDTVIGSGWTLSMLGTEGRSDKTAGVAVTLTLSGVDSDVVEMKISNLPTFGDANWLPFASSFGWILPSGDGTKTVYVKLRDRAGNEISKSASITLDQTPPDPPALQVIDTTGDGFALSNTSVELQWSLPTGAEQFELQRLIRGLNTDFLTILTPVAPQLTYTDTVTQPGSRYQYRIRCRDDIGNYSAWSLVAEAYPFEPNTSVAWIRQVDRFRYNFPPNPGTFSLYPTYRYDNVTGATTFEPLVANLTYFVRPAPTGDIFDEFLLLRTANQDSSLVYDSAVPLNFSTRETIADSWGNTSLALDANGAVHIAYRGKNNDRVMYTNNIGGQWSTPVAVGNYPVFLYGQGLVIDSQGNAHIAHWQGWSPGKLMYSTNSGQVLRDDFEAPFGKSNWSYVSPGVERNSLGIGEPSGTFSLNLDGGGDIIESVSLDPAWNMSYSYYFERKGGGETPDPGDYLYFEAFNGSVWTTLQTHGSTSGSVTSYTLVTGTLPAGTTKVRFRSTGSGEGFDDWFVDNVRITVPRGTWATRVVDDGAGSNVGLWPSIALDKNDRIHIAYQDETAKDLKYANDVTDAWGLQTVDTSDNAGYYTSIKVDSQSRVHISYIHSTQGLKYAKYESGTWSLTVLDSANSNFTSLGLDANDDIHIAYRKNALYYIRTNSGLWGSPTPIDSASNSASPSLALDKRGFVHVSYHDTTNKNLRYVTNISGTWVRRAIEEAGAVGAYSSIAADDLGQVHISYYDQDLNKLKYAKYVPPSWVPWAATSLDTAANVGGHTSLAVDATDATHIVYYDSTNTSLKYATNKLGVWTTSTLDNVEDDGQYASLAIGPNNKLYVSYRDSTNKDLKFITNEAGAWGAPLTIDSANDVGQYSHIAVGGAGQIHVVYYDGTNYKLRHRFRNSSGWESPEVLDDSWGSMNLAIDSTQKVHITYRSNTGRLRYISGYFGAWSTPQTLGNKDPFLYGTAITVDANGKVHIATYGGWPGELQYVTNQSGSWVVTTIDSENDAGRNPSIRLDQAGKVHITYWRGQALYYATNVSGFWQTSALDNSPLVGAYSSLAIDSKGRLHVSYHDEFNYDLKYTFGYFAGLLQATSITRTNPF